MPNPLDNPVWHALTGPHAHVAIGQGAARRYPPAISPFAAIAEPTQAAYTDLAANVPPGQNVVLLRPAHEPMPPAWESHLAQPLDQMILPPTTPLPEPHPAEATTVPLGPNDVAEMLALIELTKPGPFGPRTVELGGYVGVRDPGGRLIAMAGQRFRLPGHVELSAVCVHPDAQGRGLGAALTLAVSRAIISQGEIPILHGWPDNPARALYLKLGFQLRAKLWILMRCHLPHSGPGP